MPARRRRLARALLAAALLAAAPAAAAPGEAVAGMLLDLPDPAAGWTRSAPADGSGLLLRRDLPPGPDGRRGGSALILVQRPAAATRPLPDALDAASRLDALAEGPPMLRRAGVTANGHPAGWVLRCCRARSGAARAEARVFGVESPRGQVFLTLVMVGVGQDAARPLEAEFAAVARSLRPSPGDRALDFAPGKDATAGDAAAGLVGGLFTALETGLRPNVFGGTDFVAENEVMLFGPGGVYARALPPDGGAEDLGGFCRASPARCGLWRVLPGTPPRLATDAVQDAFGLIRREERPLARDGPDLLLGERRQRWRHVQPFPDDARLEGTWRHLYASSGSGAFSSGSVAVERVLTLTRDGRFARSGFAGASTTNEAGGGRTGVTVGTRRPAEAGRYRLEGYRLTLTGEDGRSEALSVFRPDAGSDGLLVIGGANYLRREGGGAGGGGSPAAGPAKDPAAGGDGPAASGTLKR